MHREKSVEEIRREQFKCVEILYQTIDAQLKDFQRIRQKLSSALSPYSDYLPEPVAKYRDDQLDDLEHWRSYGGKDGFKPSQPRGPDGCWIRDDAIGSPDKGEMDIDTAVYCLNGNAKPKSPAPGEGECAKYVREAIEAGGVKFKAPPPPVPVYAKDYHPYLGDYFEDITPTKLDKYSPKKGDIAVFQSPDLINHPHGHIQMYNGKEWVSDFKQGEGKRHFWPGPTYRDKKPRYAIYRPDPWEAD